MHSTVNTLVRNVTADSLAAWLSATTMHAGTGTSGRLPPPIGAGLGAVAAGPPGAALGAGLGPILEPLVKGQARDADTPEAGSVRATQPRRGWER